MNKQLGIGVTIGIVVIYLIATAIPTIDARDNPLIIQSGSGGGGGVTSLTPSSGLGANATTGDILIFPKWALLCQNTLTVNADTLSCGNLTDRDKLFINIQLVGSGSGTNFNPSLRFNGDGGNNYSYRVSLNGGADSTATSTNRIDFTGSTIGNTDAMEIDCFIMNNSITSNIRKGISCYSIAGSLGASVASPPFRTELAGKYSDTTNPISIITLTHTLGTSQYGVGTTITVWGYD